MAVSTKVRQPRLRASCDGCFLAKVKCSKARPLCSRCLACGLDCRYSPSSRAGKPKQDHSAASNTNRHSISQMQSPQAVALNYAAVSQLPAEHMFETANGWVTPPSSVEGTMSRNPSLSSNLSHFGTEASLLSDNELMAAAAVDFSGTLPWTPPNDLSYQLADIPLSTSPMSATHIRSMSLDSSMATNSPWTDAISPDAMNFGNTLSAAASVPTAFMSTPPPSATQSSFSVRKPTSPIMNGGSCTCFTACLQSLQALHNASSPALPPFDHVLSLNGKAVEGCAAMLNCTKCISRSGTQTSTMLLATIIGKIASFYKSASATYFENSTTSPEQSPGSHGVSYGVYQLNGEDGKWFELEILSRELRKLDEVYAKFREVCSEFSDDPEVNKAMIDYLGQNLGSTLEVVNHRKVDKVSAFVY